MGFETFAQTCFSGLANGALYAFIALGFSLVNRSTGIINFAQGDLTMLGGMLVAVLSTAGLPLWLAVPLAVACCGLVSALFYQLAIRPARRASMSQLTIMTIGLSILVRGIVVTVWGSDPQSVPAFSGDMPMTVRGVSILPQEVWLIVALFVTVALTSLFFRRTMLGLALRASASNPLGASYMGISPARLGLVAFSMAGLLGGLGGAIWTPIYFAQVDVGLGLGLKGFAAAVIGGIATTWGPIAGGIVLALVEAFAGGYVSSGWEDALLYGLMLLALLVRPQGLLGKKSAPGGDEKPVASTRMWQTTLGARDLGMLAAGTLLMMLAPLVLGNGALTSLIFAGIMSIVVLGLVLVTGFGGQLALGQGAFMMIGAYASGYLTVLRGWPPLAAMLCGMALATLTAIGLGRMIFRLRGYYLSMASLGTLMIALTIGREWVSVTGGANGLPGIGHFSLAGFAFTTDRMNYELVTVAAALTGLGALFLARSRTGRALLAVRSSESAARACGVNVEGLKTQVFAFSAATASMAGSLYVHYVGIANPTPFGVEATIAQVTALTIGGYLYVSGAYIGAAAVITLPALITWIAGSTGSQAMAGAQSVVFGVLMVALILVQSTEPARRRKGSVEMKLPLPGLPRLT